MKANKIFAAFAAAALVLLTACGGNGGPGNLVVNVAPEAADIEMQDGKYAIVFQPVAGSVCNDIIFMGNYNGWNDKDVAANLVFTELKDFEGWYIVYVPAPAAGEDGEVPALQGKPVQLKNDGSFSWDFQTGDSASWTVLNGGVEIKPGYSGESDLTYTDMTAPVILKSASWKNVPCDLVEEKVTVTVKVPACGCPENVDIIGGFDGWAGTQMTKVSDGVYSAEIVAAAGVEYKFREAGTWDNEILVLNEETDEWKGMDNIVLGESKTVEHDFSGAGYKWTACEE